MYENVQFEIAIFIHFKTAIDSNEIFVICIMQNYLHNT